RSAACPPDSRTVWARPPMRSRASRTTNVRPASWRAAAAASPAAPAPTTTQSRTASVSGRFIRRDSHRFDPCEQGKGVGAQARAVPRSDVIAEHELLRMGVEVDLVADVGEVEPGHVVVDERDRNDQGDQASRVVLDEAEKLPLLAGREPVLEEAQEV